jgi:DNA polymerase III delta prime subunit
MSKFKTYLSKVRDLNYNETAITDVASKGKEVATNMMNKGKEIVKNLTADVKELDSKTIKNFKEAFYAANFKGSKDLALENALDGAFKKGWMSKTENDTIKNYINATKKDIYKRRGYSVYAGLFKDITDSIANINTGLGLGKNLTVPRLADHATLKANAAMLIESLNKLNKTDAENKEDFNLEQK